MKDYLKKNIFIKITVMVIASFMALISITGCSTEESLSCDFPFSKSLYVAGGFIYTTYTSLCGGDVLESGILIADVDDPQVQTGIGGKTKDWANDLYVEEDYAYIANGANGFLIVDVSDKENPRVEGRADTPGYSNSLSVTGRYAFVADGESGVQVIDITDKKNPEIIKEYDTPGYAFDLYIYDGKIYVADGEKGLYIIDTDLIE